MCGVQREADLIFKNNEKTVLHCGTAFDFKCDSCGLDEASRGLAQSKRVTVNTVDMSSTLTRGNEILHIFTFSL